MSTTVTRRPATTAAGRADEDQRVAVVFVIFGITGDLAKVMTFNSLYRLEKRGLLSCPIVGVAVSDWSAQDLRDHARSAIESLRRADRRAGVRPLRGAAVVRQRRLRRPGDLSASTRLPISDAQVPVFYRDPAVFVRPGDPGTDRGRRHQATRRVGGRETVRSRPGVSTGSGGRYPSVHRRVPAVPDRPLPRENGPGRDPLPAVRQLDVRPGLEPQQRRERADDHGRELRRGGSRPLLRPGRCAARRGR